MIKLSYSTFGLTNVDFLDSISEVDKAGYPGIELAFHRDQFNPFNLTDDYVAAIKKRLATVNVKPPVWRLPRISLRHPDLTNRR